VRIRNVNIVDLGIISGINSERSSRVIKICVY
jgi:hypothetical protein